MRQTFHNYRFKKEHNLRKYRIFTNKLAVEIWSLWSAYPYVIKSAPLSKEKERSFHRRITTSIPSQWTVDINRIPLCSFVLITILSGFETPSNPPPDMINLETRKAAAAAAAKLFPFDMQRTNLSIDSVSFIFENRNKQTHTRTHTLARLRKTSTWSPAV